MRTLRLRLCDELHTLFLSNLCQDCSTTMCSFVFMHPGGKKKQVLWNACKCARQAQAYFIHVTLNNIPPTKWM